MVPVVQYIQSHSRLCPLNPEKACLGYIVNINITTTKIIRTHTNNNSTHAPYHASVSVFACVTISTIRQSCGVCMNNLYLHGTCSSNPPRYREQL